MILDVVDKSKNNIHPDFLPIQKLSRNASQFTFSNRTRYVILVLSIVTLSIVIGNSLALNFTIICMVDESDIINEDAKHYSHNLTEPKPMFSSTERSIFFSAVAIGTLIGSLLITQLLSKYGFRKVFVAFGAISGAAMLLTPPAVLIGVPAVVLMRIAQGIAISATTVAMGAISTEWATTKATGTFIAILSCHIQFGPIITMPLAGVMCNTLGWEWLYYIQGTISLAVFALFFYFYRDSPRFQRHVSTQELTILEKGKLHLKSTNYENVKIPYRDILTDSFTWGFLATSIACMLSINLISQFGPVYLNKVLGINVEATGIMSAVPFILSIVVKMTSGPLSDKLACISEKARIIMFASISQFFVAGFCTTLAILSTKYLTIIQIIYTLIIVFSGLNAVGSFKGVQKVTQHFCHVIMAWLSLGVSLTTLVTPLIVNAFAPDDTPEQWGHLFIFIAVIVAVANMAFICTYNGQTRPYVINSGTKPANEILKNVEKCNKDNNKY